MDVTTKTELQSIERQYRYVQTNTNTFTSLFLFLGVLLGLGSGEFELQMSVYTMSFGKGKRTDSGLSSRPGPTGSHDVEPLSKFRNACVSSRGSMTIRFFSSS